MTPKTVKIATKGRASRYEIRIGPGLIRDTGSTLRGLMPEARRVLVVSNKKVFGLYGEKVRQALRGAKFETAVHLIGDGERFKNIRTVAGALDAMNRAGISRSDAVVALGGGVIGDVAGFAAAVHMRGVRFLQIPTTLLAMIDSSVGGKTGVNSPHGKNLIGAFHQPAGVVIDPAVLVTLPERELTAGFCEAVKQAAIAGGDLFRKTGAFLDHFDRRDLRSLEPGTAADADLADLIALHAAFKAKIVAGDERESAENTGPRSRKILNFGHTFAHALEKVTSYKLLRHGEAVGYGILFAAELSKRLELMNQNEVNLLYDVVRSVGRLPDISSIDPKHVNEAFKYDKKIVGSDLQWVLLRGIGKPVIVPGSEIPQKAIQSASAKLLRK
jgi:3-dehydroquinate synthase